MFTMMIYVHCQWRPPINQAEYDSYGSLLAMNEHLAIFAQNDKSQFSIITNPTTPALSHYCSARYITIEHYPKSWTYFIYSLAIGAKQNSTQLYFAYIDEDWRNDVFLSVVRFEKRDSGCVAIDAYFSIYLGTEYMRESCIVGMDPYGKRAYAVGVFYTIFVDIETGQEYIVYHSDLHGGLSYFQIFFPKAMVVTDDNQLFIVGQRQISSEYHPYLYLFDFSDISMVTYHTSIELSTFNYGQEAINMNRYTFMSISINERSRKVLVGIPSLDMIVFLTYNVTNYVMIAGYHVLNKTGTGYGKSVTLLDNHTYAVLAYELPTLPWSTSQIQVRRNIRSTFV
ncbi:unnamed protein product [Rotaria sp. Silwood2]|nr:unnamed protein product [Rotaria sp. Silwood2]CAF3131756.1 unnamed protein product [Rotaria sp. Silwood2]CAF3366707.1 unnamed protein product [Rotaria sp. Silwood2]CAF3424354.1 unnamed protein product [Rotaria sp. Silwood2]CAF4448849.1 unnamed protein product [Rotaria sp. Silwood2]